MNKENNTPNNEYYNIDINKSMQIACAVFAGFYITKSLWNYFKKSVNKMTSDIKSKSTNTICITHKYKPAKSLLDKDEVDSVDISSHLKFIKDYEKADKDRDINVVLQTIGGNMICAEAISNCILNHKGKGIIRCYIPNYAFSAGLMIALCCDEIILSKNAIIAPCDGQLVTKGKESYSTSSIIEAVKYKKDKNEPIKEEWLVAYSEAEKCVQRQKSFLDLLHKSKLNDGMRDRFNEEFFSGKYNHDRAFSANQFIEIVNSSIDTSENKKTLCVKVDEIPRHILDLLDYNLEN